MNKAFLKNDVTILKANLINEDQLNTLTGGTTATDKPTTCKCACYFVTIKLER